MFRKVAFIAFVVAVDLLGFGCKGETGLDKSIPSFNESYWVGDWEERNQSDPMIPMSPPAPSLHLDASLHFQFTSIPCEYFSNLKPTGKLIEMEGTWVLGDDGDGSLAVLFTVTSLDGKPVTAKLLARPGNTAIYMETDHAGTAMFVRMPAKK